MARPKKQTVDYFPHYVSDGKTKLILQNEFGNDGYAFWYKLLELLCESENQVYDYNNSPSWKFLLAKTLVTDDTAVKILQLLADLGTIDPKLHKSKIIWCQNLIENLELVYRRRATGIPEKPVNVNKNRQTKQDNTKLNNKENTKRKYGEFKNVLLTDEEYQKLKDKLGGAAGRFIENLSGYLESRKRKHYDSHYATILNWSRKEEKVGKARNPRNLPETYTKSTNDDV